MSDIEKLKLYTVEEVAKHNTKTDCWIIVNKKVYDITKFIEEDLHPGGNYILLVKAGEDVTETMNDIGHSKEAFDMLKSYYIGDLCDTR
jgi:cytochrome b involved in lipid metabolism